ncbi:MAG: aminotransferase class III-fold pyridoxal phosphate-dependent enzyme [Acidimicrobiia bacterium]
MQSQPKVRNVDRHWFERARLTDARALTRADVLPDHANGFPRFPRYVSRCDGAYVWDIDGNRYIDYLLGYGPIVLGHCNRVVNHAAMKELANGNCFSPLWSRRQVELTEKLTEVIPGAEMALLLKTGSDATSAAVRLARIATGRDAVLRWGYNGWHDWSVHEPAGVPATSRARSFDINDLSDLERRLAAEPVACVVTMPFENDESPFGRLTDLQRMTHAHGALLVLDEMRSGFRLALGGAQAYLDVQADLATFSKALANGYAISAVTGRREVLEGLRSTKISSTFFASPVDMAAALATIDVLEHTDALDRIWTAGTSLLSGLRSIIRELGAPAEAIGYPPMPFLRFTQGGDGRHRAIRDKFYEETTSRGLLLHPDHQWFLSAAHTELDIERTLVVCHQAMKLALSYDAL